MGIESLKQLVGKPWSQASILGREGRGYSTLQRVRLRQTTSPSFHGKRTQPYDRVVQTDVCGLMKHISLGDPDTFSSSLMIRQGRHSYASLPVKSRAPPNSPPIRSFVAFPGQCTRQVLQPTEMEKIGVQFRLNRFKRFKPRR